MTSLHPNFTWKYIQHDLAGCQLKCLWLKPHVAASNTHTDLLIQHYWVHVARTCGEVDCAFQCSGRKEFCVTSVKGSVPKASHQSSLQKEPEALKRVGKKISVRVLSSMVSGASGGINHYYPMRAMWQDVSSWTVRNRVKNPSVFNHVFLLRSPVSLLLFPAVSYSTLWALKCGWNRFSQAEISEKSQDSIIHQFICLSHIYSPHLIQYVQLYSTRLHTKYLLRVIQRCVCKNTLSALKYIVHGCWRK